ncbi:ribonuclease H-like domain-containing protein [Halobacteria archaeon AArc-dxtr1]|nr:ribonuclease H-like domain-containing protein [Halobacteria archaeon AArc-dxtr1]
MRIENSFIPVPGVGEATERRLWEHGITHWDEFDGSVVGETLADRIDQFIAEGRRHLEQDNLAFFAESLPTSSQWRLYENARSEACFLDIETTGLDATCNDVTTVSVYRGGEMTTLVRGDDLERSRLQAELDAASLLVTFNGKRFDVPFLEECYDVDASTPHVDLMYSCQSLGLDGGLKRIERDLGIERDRPDITGRDAVRLWREYERGDEGALETLVAYNRADTENLQTVMEIVSNRLHRSVFEAIAGPRDGDVR